MRAIVNGIELHYELHGSPRGWPLLLVHGFPLTGEMWSGLVELLGDQFRLIIPDLRGFGKSQLAAHIRAGESQPISIAHYADDLASLLAEIGEQRPAVIIGLSMGGYIALEFYRRYASSVVALVLADTRAEADSEVRRKERFETAQRVLSEGSHVVADSMAAKLFAPGAPKELVARWRAIMRAIAPEAIATALLAMAGRINSIPTLRTIYCPSLVMVGEEDSITPLSDALRIHGGIVACQLNIIPHAGHMTPVEQPERFAAALRQFLVEHLPRQ